VLDHIEQQFLHRLEERVTHPDGQRLLSAVIAENGLDCVLSTHPLDEPLHGRLETQLMQDRWAQLEG
jgi:hypothetical protein